MNTNAAVPWSIITWKPCTCVVITGGYLVPTTAGCPVHPIAAATANTTGASANVNWSQTCKVNLR